MSGLARVLTGLTLVVCVATFATGWWVFEQSRAEWLLLGALICGAPVVAAAVAWVLVLGAMRRAADLLADLTAVTAGGRDPSVLIDHDTGDVLSRGTWNVRRDVLASPLVIDVERRRRELPALYASVRALTRVPLLALVAVAGVIGVGLLGTLLLIVGLVT